MPRSSDMGPPNITPAGPAVRRLRVPTRGDLSARPTRLLKAGAFNKADLLVIDIGDGPLVVKDFSAKSGWYRLIGRVQLWREERAYRLVGEVEGLPRFAGRIDAHALAVERVEGKNLGPSAERAVIGPPLFPRLVAVIEGLHARGLLHWDLRSRDNVMYTDDGRVFVLDLASAVFLRVGGLPHKLLFKWLKRIDDSALLKWKHMLGAGPLSPGEARFLRRFERIRRVWLFDAKHPWRRKRLSADQSAVEDPGA